MRITTLAARLFGLAAIAIAVGGLAPSEAQAQAFHQGNHGRGHVVVHHGGHYRPWYGHGGGYRWPGYGGGFYRGGYGGGYRWPGYGGGFGGGHGGGHHRPGHGVGRPL
ncbi:hypothetical protein [Singulisphaera acidiphila]|uniref:Sulfur globule protein n=1 Tax=Singulisphaera acidiphila (strain ATCC BAA-1392 / DSM 18658 / VKM B-2454 / MOB10) TaxID=886293 RepID=L0D9I5_SINAD|nr:hypothetical protein [Singulisphaera acidiphila]AGA25882.1 hypothetical protein Sinac_1502 [Singulisphaera acidiphila DSM 18658]